MAKGAERAGPAFPRGQGVCLIVDPLLTLGCRDSEASPPADTTQSAGGQSEQQLGEGPVLQTSTVPRYDPRRLAVTFRRNTPKRTISALFAQAGVTLERSIPQINAYLVGVEPRRRAAALTSIRGSPAVTNAGREVLADALDSNPDDSDWPLQVGLRVVGFPKAWDVTRGSTRVVVAVADTGVDPGQPDLRGALVPGYDFVNSNAHPDDDMGHGTAVAGIIAARTNNGQGLAGICWFCSIMPIKVLDATGTGGDTTIAAGVVWAVDHGARVINLSLGGPGASQELADAAAYAVGKGAVVIAAAGNSGTTIPFYPAADPNAIGVAATTAADHPYAWSNFGPWVNVAAPGCNVAPVLSGGYGSFCGTSSATPVVAGLVALAESFAPEATPAQIRAALEQAAVPLPGVVQYGRIDAPATLSFLRAATPPAAPFQVRTVLRGTLDRRRPVRSYSIDVGAGRLTATLVFNGARTLSLTLAGKSGGPPIARVTGASPLRLDRSLPAGRVRLIVRGGATRTSFRLVVTYVRQPV